MKNVAFLFSGRGSLLWPLHLLFQTRPELGRLTTIITNNAEASLEPMRNATMATVCLLDHKHYATRAAHEKAIGEVLERDNVDLLVLGGYRRIFTAEFVARYPNRIINTHPSLLPAFPGDRAQQKAIERGVRFTGTTVHFANNDVDQGPIILQGVVPVLPGATADTLKSAIIEKEKVLLPLATELFCEERLSVHGDTVHIRGFEQLLDKVHMV